MRLLLALAAGLLALAPPALADDPPNILVVILDDVGVDQFASYGEAGACSGNGNQCFADGDCPGAQTCIEDYAAMPTVDRFVDEGVLFRNVYAAPSCKTARAAGITGRYPFRTGVFQNSDPFPTSERTIAEALQDPAIVPTTYATAAFGKWGLGNDVSPLSKGFDRFVGHLGSGLGGDFFTWNRTVDTQTSSCSQGSPPCSTESYATSVNVNDAVEWIGNQTSPWFVWFSFNAPHSPWQVPPHELVTPETLARLPEDGMGNPAPEGTECNGAFRRPCYLAMLEALDTELDRLVSAVPENTWLILLGDNGTPGQITQLPFRSSKGSIFEGGINVPLVVRSPELTSAGSESAAFVHIVDLFSTVIEIAGGTPPQDRLLDSLSLVPVVEDPTVSMRAVAFGEGNPGQVARDARYKLIRGAGSDSMYDLEADPFEQTDLLLGTLTPEQQAAYDALSDEVFGVFIAAGRVPDGKFVPGSPLMIAKAPAGRIELLWSDSCTLDDSDYNVYEGVLGAFDSHAPAECGTGGALSATLSPAYDAAYYLVVPSNGTREGSYGTSSRGVPRFPGAAFCLPQAHAGCY